MSRASRRRQARARGIQAFQRQGKLRRVMRALAGVEDWRDVRDRVEAARAARATARTAALDAAVKALAKSPEELPGIGPLFGPPLITIDLPETKS